MTPEADKKYSKSGFPAGMQQHGAEHTVNVKDKHNEINSEGMVDFLMETWEPLRHLIKCKDKVEEFKKFEQEQKKKAKEKKKRDVMKQIEKMRKHISKQSRNNKPNRY